MEFCYYVIQTSTRNQIIMERELLSEKKKKEEAEEMTKTYSESLTHHKDPETLKNWLVNECEKLLMEQKKRKEEKYEIYERKEEESNCFYPEVFLRLLELDGLKRVLARLQKSLGEINVREN